MVCILFFFTCFFSGKQHGRCHVTLRKRARLACVDFSWGGKNHQDTEKKGNQCEVSCRRFPTGVSMKISQIASASTSSTVAASHWSHNASCDIARPTQHSGCPVPLLIFRFLCTPCVCGGRFRPRTAPGQIPQPCIYRQPTEAS